MTCWIYDISALLDGKGKKNKRQGRKELTWNASCRLQTKVAIFFWSPTWCQQALADLRLHSTGSYELGGELKRPHLYTILGRCQWACPTVLVSKATRNWCRDDTLLIGERDAHIPMYTPFTLQEVLLRLLPPPVRSNNTQEGMRLGWRRSSSRWVFSIHKHIHIREKQ